MSESKNQNPTNFIRYEADGQISFGMLEGDQIRRLDGDFMAGGQPDGTTRALDDVRLLAPVATGLDYSDLGLQTRLNGEVVQEARTSDLIFDIPQILEYITRYVTLEPGDLVFTGTPGTTSRINDGDTVEVEIEGVGVLRNGVRTGEATV